ncbi:MAG: ABC transporter ATP-binding protein [Candidatus Sericytochromatia bacterium]
MLQIIDLVKTYHGHQALHGISLTLKDGELFGLLGPNGAGKSTTIKCCVGLLEPTSGRVLIDGQDVKEHGREMRRSLAYLPDEPLLYDRLTAREFIMLVGNLYGVPKPLITERIPGLLDLLGLTAVADRWAGTYSHGQRQRLALAAALVYEPKLIFLDEPTVGLDPVGAHQLKEILRRLCHEKGVTVVLATHILEMAEILCHRVGVISHGRLRGIGTVSELREQLDSPGASLEAMFMRLVA